MEINNAINTRRSIRKYLDKEVEHDKLVQLIDAAIKGPTWKNSQTGRYYVIEDKQLLKEFHEKCLPEFNSKNATNAKIIVTTFKEHRSGYDKDGTPSTVINDFWGAYDLGLCNQNILLKAVELGLGTLVMGIYNRDAIYELLNIPKEEVVMAVIAVGYPDIEPEMPKRKSVEDVSKFL